MVVHRMLRFTLALCSLLAAGCDASSPSDPSGGETLSVREAKGISSFAAPSTATAAALTTDRIDVSWQDNSSSESRFEIHRSVAGGAYSLLSTKPVNSEVHTDAALNPSTSYCYRIRAVRITGNRMTYSTFSNSACAVTPAIPPPPITPPPTPTGTRAVAYTTTVFVSWNAWDSNASGFRIERATGAGGAWVDAGSPTGHWQFGEYAVAENQVCYRVIALNAGGTSLPSDSACVTPLAEPTGFTAVRVAGGVELTWSDNTAFETGYAVALEYKSCCNDACDAFDPYYYYEVVAELPPNSTRFFYPTEMPARSCTLLYLTVHSPNSESGTYPLSLP